MVIKKSLIWFRKNLRVFDNLVLRESIANSDTILPFYVLDNKIYADTIYGFKRQSDFRLNFLYQSLENLKHNLELMNLSLNIFSGDSFEIISFLVNKYDITDIYYEKDIAYEERRLEKKLKTSFLNVKFHKYNSNHIFKYDLMKSKVKRLQDTFTRFRRTYEQDFLEADKECININFEHSTKLIKLKSEDINLDLTFNLHTNLESLKSQTHVISDTRATFLYEGGEDIGLDRIKNYIWNQKSIKRYKRTRNGLMGRNFSSRFSAWLSLGCISVNHIMHEIEKFENEELKNDSTYWSKFELLWREYFHLLYGKYKSKLFFLKGPHEREVEHNLDEEICQAWISGKLGVPFIDANMISLKQTGYLSNRGRQNVVSYFVHDLKQDWRFAASYLESVLVDYDVYSNWLNCAYITGLVATEKAHVFDVNSQAEHYDSKGQFVKHWLENSDLS